jgi:hypothetical protein
MIENNKQDSFREQMQPEVDKRLEEMRSDKSKELTSFLKLLRDFWPELLKKK